MKATMSLRELRTDPRKYIRLLNEGYEVDITEHRKTVATAKTPDTKRQGSYQAIMKAVNDLPADRPTPYPEMDTPAYVKKIKSEYLEKKYGAK